MASKKEKSLTFYGSLKLRGLEKSLLESLRQMRTDEMLCDITLNNKADPQSEEITSHPAHACVLAASSTLLYDIFSKDSEVKELHLESFSNSALETCIRLLYGESVNVSDCSIDSLKLVAESLGFASITELCTKISQQSETSASSVSNKENDVKEHGYSSPDEKNNASNSDISDADEFEEKSSVLQGSSAIIDKSESLNTDKEESSETETPNREEESTPKSVAKKMHVIVHKKETEETIISKFKSKSNPSSAECPEEINEHVTYRKSDKESIKSHVEKEGDGAVVNKDRVEKKRTDTYCFHCGHTFASRESLMKHRKRLLKKSTKKKVDLHCDHCNHTFSTPTALRNHKNRLLLDPEFRGRGRGYSSPYYMKLKAKYSKEDISCDQCGAVFSLPKSLEKHIRSRWRIPNPDDPKGYSMVCKKLLHKYNIGTQRAEGEAKIQTTSKVFTKIEVDDVPVEKKATKDEDWTPTMSEDENSQSDQEPEDNSFEEARDEEEPMEGTSNSEGENESEDMEDNTKPLSENIERENAEQSRRVKGKAITRMIADRIKNTSTRRQNVDFKDIKTILKQSNTPEPKKNDPSVKYTILVLENKSGTGVSTPVLSKATRPIVGPEVLRLLNQSKEKGSTPSPIKQLNQAGLNISFGVDKTQKQKEDDGAAAFHENKDSPRVVGDMNNLYCAHCDYTFTSRDGFRKHKKRLAVDPVFRERTSIEGRRSNSDYMQLKKKYADNPITCDQCHKRFAHPACLKKHVKLRKKIPDANDPSGYSLVCKSLIPQELRVKQKRENVTENRNCDRCDETFPTLYALRHHKVSVHGDVEKKKQSKSESKRKSYYKASQCETCGEVFETAWQRKKHIIVVHKKEFFCKFCNKSIYQPFLYRSHMRRHYGIKPFLCSKCDFRAVTKREIDLHEEMYHGNSEYHCSSCPTICKTSQALRLHEKKHSGPPRPDRKVACSVCSKTLGNSQLISHMRRVHNIDVKRRNRLALDEISQEDFQEAQKFGIDPDAVEEMQQISSQVSEHSDERNAKLDTQTDSVAAEEIQQHPSDKNIRIVEHDSTKETLFESQAEDIVTIELGSAMNIIQTQNTQATQGSVPKGVVQDVDGSYIMYI